MPRSNLDGAMDRKKITIKKTLDVSQIAAFFRLLAAELEGTPPLESNELGKQLHDFNKLTIALIKQEGGQLALSLKVKERGQKAAIATTEFTDVAEHDYRPFKRHLKSTFAELGTCASQATLPSTELLSRFMAESQRLISFPGFGDTHYSDYWQACLAMDQAAKNGTALAFQEKWAAVNAIKKACHSRYK